MKHCRQIAFGTLLIAASLNAAGSRARRAMDRGRRRLRLSRSAGRITGVDLHASWVTDSDLRKLAQLPDLTYLDLSLTRISDQGMQEI